MKKFRLLIEYDGTAYHGWQVQKDATTIQGILEDRIFILENGAVLDIGRDWAEIVETLPNQSFK